MQLRSSQLNCFCIRFVSINNSEHKYMKDEFRYFKLSNKCISSTSLSFSQCYAHGIADIFSYSDVKFESSSNFPPKWRLLHSRSCSRQSEQALGHFCYLSKKEKSEQVLGSILDGFIHGNIQSYIVYSNEQAHCPFVFKVFSNSCLMYKHTIHILAAEGILFFTLAMPL